MADSRASYSSRLRPILLPRSRGEPGARANSPNSDFNSELYSMLSSTYHLDQSMDHTSNSPQNKQPPSMATGVKPPYQTDLALRTDHWAKKHSVKSLVRVPEDFTSFLGGYTGTDEPTL